MRKTISVIGSAGCSAQELETAYEVGRGIGENGAVLICGGLGGVMESAAKGAKEFGALTIGILPGADKSIANPYIDIPILTTFGEARNVIVALSADALIAIGGSLGTLSELAFAMKRKKPVIGIKTWDLDKIYCDKVNIISVSNAQEAIEQAFSFA
ncbi:TIGR00725 family protein [Candidatus Omnitrophota bacterium]